jgi:hypothetical protein
MLTALETIPLLLIGGLLGIFAQIIQILRTRSLFALFNLHCPFLEPTNLPPEDSRDYAACELVFPKSHHDSTHVCIRFMPSSDPELKPNQLVTAPTLALASTILTIPLTIVAALPTFRVCRMMV